METWKAINGYEGHYSVSNIGRVRRDRPSSNTFTGRILKPSTSGKYLRVGLTKDGFKKIHSVHRLVATSFLGLPAKNLVVNHKNLNKQDNRLENLEFVTSKENKIHSCENGIQVGSSCYNAKLNEQNIIDIRREYKSGFVTQQFLANKYNVSQVLISVVVLNKRWKHVH